MNDETQPTDSPQAGSDQAHLGAEAVDRARATLDHARDDARALVDRARETALSALERQKAEAANQIDGIAKALKAAADALQEQEVGPAAVYAGRAAESLSSMAEALNHQDLQSLLQRTRDMARRQPALFVGGAVALGFGLARFLKTSAEEDTSDETAGPQKSANPGGARTARRRPSSSTKSGAKQREQSDNRWEGPQFGEMVGSSAAQGAEQGER